MERTPGAGPGRPKGLSAMNRRRRVATIGLCAVLAATVSGRAQTPMASAALRGVVVTADEPPKAVRRAIVSLWGGTHPLGHHTVSDDEGRFELVNLPAGRYNLSASRAPYVSISYGATRPGWPGTPLVLSAGDSVNNVTVLMARGAAITGTVTDVEGEAISNLTVRVEQIGVPAVPGSTRREATTDEHGVYRVFGLAAGRYVVSARPTPSGSSVIHELRDVEVDRLLVNLRSRSIPGKTEPVSAAQPVAAPLSDFVPVYYSNTFDPGDAASVRLTPGEERSSVDILVRLMPMAGVSGRVISSDPQHLTGIELTLTRLASQPTADRASTSVLKDGSFSFSNATPGRYRLLARAVRSNPTGPGKVCRIASAEVLVTGEPLSGLTLPLTPCPRILGRLEFTGATSPIPASLAGIRVRLDPAEPNDATLTTALHPPVASDAEGRFVLGEYGEVRPGKFTLQIDSPQRDSSHRWHLQSLTADGRDILDLPLEITDNGSQSITVSAVFTDRQSSLSGVLQDPNGKPAPELTVLVFPVNREWWRGPFRRVRTARPASDGSFDFPDLPPGDYYLAALAEVAPGEWLDPAFLSETATAALSLSVRPGERKIQNFRVAK